MKKIYLVKVVKEVPVLADDEYQAEDVARRFYNREEVAEVEDVIEINSHKLARKHDLIGCVPWGADDDKLIEKYLPEPGERR